MNFTKDYVMYIFVNDDLKMTKGKIASQVGHVVQKIVESIYHNVIPNNTNKKYKEIHNNYILWNNGCKKIILKATKQELINLQEEHNSFSIYDAGKTQIEPNSLTCVGFYPSCYNQEKFKKYKLL